MYTPQFTVTAVAAEAISAIRRGCRTSSAIHAQRRSASRMTVATPSDHTIRCARISRAPAGSSSGQYSGKSPHSPYAAKP